MGSSFTDKNEPGKILHHKELTEYKEILLEEIKKILEESFKGFKLESKENKKNVKNKIISSFQKYLNYFETSISSSKSDNKNNKKINIDPFTSYDIEMEYKEITSDLKNKARKYNLDDKEEEKENKNVALFLKNVGIISRQAFSLSNKILIDLHEQFRKEYPIKLRLEDDFIRNIFSCWIKTKENNSKNNNFYNEYLTNNDFIKKLDLSKEEKEYLIQLYYKLTVLYIHCKLSFPIIDIYFEFPDLDKNNDFEHEDMIDLINKGTNRKVNFIFLPCLLSNDAYLSNGKYYVFTYKYGKNKETFYFDKLDLKNG